MDPQISYPRLRTAAGLHSVLSDLSDTTQGRDNIFFGIDVEWGINTYMHSTKSAILVHISAGLLVTFYNYVIVVADKTQLIIPSEKEKEKSRTVTVDRRGGLSRWTVAVDCRGGLSRWTATCSIR